MDRCRAGKLVVEYKGFRSHFLAATAGFETPTISLSPDSVAVIKRLQFVWLMDRVRWPGATARKIAGHLTFTPVVFCWLRHFCFPLGDLLRAADIHLDLLRLGLGTLGQLDS